LALADLNGADIGRTCIPIFKNVPQGGILSEGSDL
jgi:hypothetical protein